MLAVDPGHTIPKQMKFPRPKEMLIYQLKNDVDCMGRIEAAKELGKIADAEIIEALIHAVNQDAFWGVRAETAHVLAEIRTLSCRDGLISALSTKNSKARTEIVRALGKFRDHTSASAIKKLAEKDPSYSVEAAATLAWSHSRLKHAHERTKADIDDVEKFMSSQLEKDSYRDMIRNAALKGIASLPGVGAGERGSALQTLIGWTHPKNSLDTRITEISYLGRLASSAHYMVREKVLDLFSELSNERNFRIRAALVAAIEASEMPAAVGILERIRNTDADGRSRRASWVAMKTAGSPPESVESLKKVIEKLEEEHKTLKNSFEAFKAEVKVKSEKTIG